MAESTKKMTCAECGVEMNHHASKVEYGEGAEDESGGTLVEAHTCPGCGRTATREAGGGGRQGGA